MADKKILGSVFQGGKTYGPNSSQEEIAELEKQLSSDDVKRLEADGQIQGLKGSRKADEQIRRNAPLTARETVRPAGVEKTEDGEDLEDDEVNTELGDGNVAGGDGHSLTLDTNAHPHGQQEPNEDSAADREGRQVQTVNPFAKPKGGAKKDGEGK